MCLRGSQSCIAENQDTPHSWSDLDLQFRKLRFSASVDIIQVTDRREEALTTLRKAFAATDCVSEGIGVRVKLLFALVTQQLRWFRVFGGEPDQTGNLGDERCKCCIAPLVNNGRFVCARVFGCSATGMIDNARPIQIFAA